MSGKGGGHEALTMHHFCKTYGWTPDQYRSVALEDIYALSMVNSAIASHERQQADKQKREAAKAKGKRR